MSYWTFAGKNGLEGAANTLVQLDDCFNRLLTQPDPDHPAVLDDAHILYCLNTSRAARTAYNKAYPLLPSWSQARLDLMIKDNPRTARLIEDDKDLADKEQRRAIRSIPIRTVGKRGGKGFGHGA